MKLRRIMAVGMTVALTATMFSGVKMCIRDRLYTQEQKHPRTFEITFWGVLLLISVCLNIMNF